VAQRLDDQRTYYLGRVASTSGPTARRSAYANALFLLSALAGMQPGVGAPRAAASASCRDVAALAAAVAAYESLIGFPSLIKIYSDAAPVWTRPGWTGRIGRRATNSSGASSRSSGPRTASGAAAPVNRLT